MVPKGRVCRPFVSIGAELSALLHSSLLSRRAASAYFTSVQLLPFGSAQAVLT